VLLVLIGLLALMAATPRADQTSATPTEATAMARAARESDPVAVPVPSEKALRFYRSGMILWVVGIVWGFAVPLVWVATGWSARLRRLASRLAGRWWYLTVTAYFLLFAAIDFVIDFPLAYYAGYVRLHDYGLSNQTLAKWLGDGVKGLAVSMVIAALFGWVPFWLLSRSPRRWWLWTSALSLPFVVLALIVSPIWIDPLFNEFGPMKDKALEADILALADRAGIAGGRVFEVDKSVDTEAVNAYVTGFGGSKRIVLWDTMLAKLERDQVLFVMAHEMGHFVLGHVVKTVAMVPLVVLVGLWLIHRTSGALLARFGARFGFSELADVAATPFLILLFGVFIFLATPLLLAHSRHQEREADRFALELTRDNRAAAEAFVRLQQENLGNPRPGAIYRIFRAAHPTLGDRIDFCNSYRPWERGEPLVYGDRFRQ
jgi:Zn-dependent protease with chaperone function